MYRLLGEFRLNRKRYSLYLLITGFGIFGPYMFVRTSQENYATTALLWALVLHFDVLRHPKSWRYVSCFAALLALATSFRLQAGPAAAALGIYTLVKTGPQIIPASVFGLIQGLLPLAIVDTITADGPFLPAWNYLLYALGDEQGGHLWGTSPWWFYLQEYFNTWYPPLSPFLIPLLWLGLRGSPALAAIILPFTFIHFGLGHKETRYFSPMIPFMQLAMFVGWEQLERIKPHLTERILEWQKSLKTLLYLFVGVGFMGSLIALNTSPTMYDELGKMIRAGKITQFTYLGNTRSPPSQFYMKTPELGPVPRLSYDEILDEGKVIPAGWLALYAAGPVIYGKIDSQCDIVYVSIAPWQQWLLSILPPKTPIRRRVNAIVHCDAPIHIERKRNQH